MKIRKRAEPPKYYLEIFQGNVPFGILEYVLVPPEIQLIDIRVQQEYRCLGYGAHLLTELLKIAVEQKCPKLFLEVRSSNEPAKKLYKKFGFKETGSRKAYYRDPVEDALLMELSVG